MKTTHPRFLRPGTLATTLTMAACLALTPAPFLLGQGQPASPASKIYVTDVGGEASINTGETIKNVAKRSVYSAQGSVIETAPPDTAGAKSFSTMVYSNGTGAFYGADTKVEVRRFVQEPFVPTRSDMETEPSISQTYAHVARGSIGLCASKLVAGSTMQYSTPHATVNVRGRKLVIEATSSTTTISMLEGESTVRAGALDAGGHLLKDGQQAVITQGTSGGANSIEIRDIPANDASRVDGMVNMACSAKKTVYFEMRDRSRSVGSSDDVLASAAGADNPFTPPSQTPRRVLPPVELISPTLPAEFTVSTARLAPPPAK